MPNVYHKFRYHIVNPNTNILILGTFNPDGPDGPTFFYGRPRNYLWELLPICYNANSLRFVTLLNKENFMSQNLIDFADVIHSLDVPMGEEGNVDDIYIDDKVEEWKDIEGLIDGLENLTAVYFTRKTFQGIPNIKNKIVKIKDHCLQNGIRFSLLETPSRFVNQAKQQHWVNTIINQNETLLP
jgi:G:T/U-mismatch repair DNA glycosylase